MTLLPDGSFLVTEKNTGFVRRVSPAFQLQPEPVVDIEVNRASERGLLGIAAHPDFSRNGYVYIFYVASVSGRDTDNPKAASDIRVARFQLDRDGVAQTPQTLITLPVRPDPFHNGSIPADNPLGADNPIYVDGLRNPFGFSFDPRGRGLFVSDNGPKGHDKLSLAMPGDNLGWPRSGRALISPGQHCQTMGGGADPGSCR